MTHTSSSQQPLQAQSHKSALLGVDLGSNHIRIGTVDPTGQVLAFRREPYSAQAKQNPRSLADQILSVTEQMIEEQTATAPVSAIGVAFPGLVDQAARRVIEITQLPSLREIDLHQEFAQKFGVPTHFDSNANAAAFAEMTNGVAGGASDWLFLHIGANVGAGLVLGGVLQRGKSGLAGAIGEVSIYAEHIGGLVKLQSMVSAENIVRRTRERLQKDKTSSLSRLGAMGGFTYDDIIAQAHAGDDLAKLMLSRTGIFIALALADVISLLNLALVAIGGAPAGRPFLVSAVAAEVRNRAFAAAFEDCEIVAAEIGAEAGVIGAALLAEQNREP
jgi:glucokinase